jgi:hypothetical protein
MWQEYSVPNNYEINRFLLILYSGDEETIISSTGLTDISDSSDKITAEEREKLTDEQKEKLVEAEEDFKEESDAIDVEPMDDDEMDLGGDSLASMMHDPENADNL